jgi:hypothetical protein
LLSDNYYCSAKNLKNKKKYKKANSLYRMARRVLYFTPLFASYHNKYAAEIPKKKYKPLPDGIDYSWTDNREIILAPKSSIKTSIILTVEDTDRLEDAIKNALAPDTDIMKKLVRSFREAVNIKTQSSRIYSKKKKRWEWKTAKYSKKVSFTKGIYIVKLDDKLSVYSARRVYSVVLDPYKYQNQQYLKNSYFCDAVKQREI